MHSKLSQISPLGLGYDWPLPPLSPLPSTQGNHIHMLPIQRGRGAEGKKQAVVAKLVSQHCECTIWSIGDPGELTLSKLNPVD